jgi:hypothetical protein
MNRPDRTSPWTLRALALLLLLTAGGQSMPVQADTVCVDTVNELIAAVQGAKEQEQTINVVTGTYDLATFYHVPEHRLAIVGGWSANCASRQFDPRLTVFTGAPDEFRISSDETIRIESIAFIDIGSFHLSSPRNLHIERVWFQNVCPDGPCPWSPVGTSVGLFGGDSVYLSHVVATGVRGYECAVRIRGNSLDRVDVLFSLFTGNDGHGLCVMPLDETSADFELSVLNSIFWNNTQHGLFTRASPHISLKHNILESTDLNPAPDAQPIQNLNVDPQFQNAAARDFRLQPTSPAINTGRIGVLFPDQDLDGGERVVGPAPDRGPFESPSTESTFQVTNTSDLLDPVVPGSLRWAIQQANATPGLDRIRFALPGCPRIIELNAPLPDITDSVFIDGYSQAGSARNAATHTFDPTLCVGLRDAALTLDHALRVPAEALDSTFLWVSGLAFGGFDVAAVRIAAGSNSWIFGNQFGGSLGGTALGTNSVNVRLGGTSHDNLVGGLEVSHRNLIGSAYSAGIELLDNSAGEEGYGNSVRNNLIGLASNGQSGAPNAIGVRVRSHRNEIEDNIISGNQGDGVLLEGTLAFDNDVRGNSIGRKTPLPFCVPPCSPALGNVGAGVRVAGGGDNNSILFNRIENSGGAGVRFEDGERNLVFGNSIGSNDGLGVDLGVAGVNPVYNSGLAVTATYANRGLNAPTLSAARGSGQGGEVSGQVAARNGVYQVQLFRNASCDASGRGEGQQLLATGSVTVSNAPVGDNGSAGFQITLPASASLAGTTLTALLSDDPDDTSEFSACRAYETESCREIFRDGLEDNPPPTPCTPP